MAAQRQSAWFVRPRPVDDPRLRLFCLPHAGGGPAVFHRWAEALPPAVELCALQLPGRGARFHETAYTQLPALLADAAAVMRPLLDAPFAFFGHSLGALLAFELSRRLRRQGQRPQCLFVSACAAPHLLPSGPPLHDLPREQFLAALRRLQGTPPQLFADRALLDVVLPVVRADLTLYETYVYREAPPLDCAITALGGGADARVSREQLEAWRAHTSADFCLRLFAGGHFYLQEDPETLLATIREALGL